MSKTRLCIVVVDDEEMLAKQLGKYLQKYFESVFVFSSPKDALAHIKNMPPDVLLSDISMPELDGLELCRLAKEVSSGIHVLFLTAFDKKEYQDTAAKLGASGFFVKPFSPSELVESIKKLNGN